jgi:hypothetical protein
MVEHRGTAPIGAVVSKRANSDALTVSRHVASDASVPDTLLPDQYFDRLTARACDTPEKRLMFAVLLDAVIQLQRRNSTGATEAEIWIRGEEGDAAPFSFPNVCDALGLDPTYLGRGLLSWRATPAATSRVPIRQLRTSHRRVTPVVRRRRRAASA